MPLRSTRCVARGLHILRLPLQLLSTIKSAACCVVSPPPCPLDLHAVSLAYVGAFGCRIGLFVALRSWLACAVLSVWLSLAELGFRCCAVRRLCRLWWPFATRSSDVAPSGASVFGRSSASVALELRSTLRRAAAADRSRLSLPRCVAPCRRHVALSTRSVQAQPPGGPGLS